MPRNRFANKAFYLEIDINGRKRMLRLAAADTGLNEGFRIKIYQAKEGRQTICVCGAEGLVKKMDDGTLLSAVTLVNGRGEPLWKNGVTYKNPPPPASRNDVGHVPLSANSAPPTYNIPTGRIDPASNRGRV